MQKGLEKIMFSTTSNCWEWHFKEPNGTPEKMFSVRLWRIPEAIDGAGEC